MSALLAAAALSQTPPATTNWTGQRPAMAETPNTNLYYKLATDAVPQDLDAAVIARVFDYRSLEGERFRNTIGDILTQLFGHSWYHRGQIAALVRSFGCDPAVTDFVFWAREPIPEPAA